MQTEHAKVMLILLWVALIFIYFFLLSNIDAVKTWSEHIESSSKIDFRAWVCHYRPNVITLSETLAFDEDIQIDGYVLFSTDRDSRGGSVATCYFYIEVSVYYSYNSN